jgi:hypothetical protein
VLSDSDINVAEGVAFCGSCKSLSRLSEMVEEQELKGVDPASPPRGCTFSSDGARTLLTASSRSVGTALGALLFATFWNSVVSVFVFVALASTLHHATGSVPAWFPAPFPSGGGSGSGGGNHGPDMTVGMTIFLWVFLVPFIGIGVGMIGVFLFALLGRVEVRLEGDRGSIFTGMGALGWRRRFDLRLVRSVTLGKTKWTSNEVHKPQIILEADRQIRFGAGVPEMRLAWVVTVLRKTLVVR